MLTNKNSAIDAQTGSENNNKTIPFVIVAADVLPAATGPTNTREGGFCGCGFCGGGRWELAVPSSLS